jgi:hypothetical protein
MDDNPIIQEEDSPRSSSGSFPDPPPSRVTPQVSTAGFNPNNLQNYTTEELQAMLSQIQKRNQDEEEEENKEDQNEREEEQHPQGERLIEEGEGQYGAKELDEEIGRVLIDLAEYRTRKIDDEEELENAGDLFLSLNTILLEPQAKKVFADHKGVDLMIILYKKQKALRSFIIKVLDFAMSSNLLLCNKFIEKGGLPILFSYFMQKSKSKKTEEIDQNNTLAIIANIAYCTSKGASGVSFDRLFYKFKENSFEK